MKTFKTIWTKPKATVDELLSMQKVDLVYQLIILSLLVIKGMTITMITATSKLMADFSHFLVSSIITAIVSGQIIAVSCWLLTKFSHQHSSNKIQQILN